MDAAFKAVGLLVLSAGSLAAQLPVAIRVSGVPSCGTCEVRVRSRVILGSRSDSVGIAGLSNVAAGGSGEFYVVSPFMPTAGALTYDSAGVLLGTLGRSGNGPGELSQAMKVATTRSGDILIQDLRGAIHVFDPAGHFQRVVRGIPSSPADITAVGDSLVAVPEVLRQAEGSYRHEIRVYELHSGRFVVALGDGITTSPGITDVATARSLSEVWLVDSPMEFSLWSLDGRHQSTLKWDPGWARHLGGVFAKSESAEPLTRARSLWQDSATGLLWVATVLQDPSKPDPFRPVEPGSPLPRDYFSPARLAASFDAIISVLDPSTGEVIVHQRLSLPNSVAQAFLDDGRLTAIHEDADGYMSVQILTLRLIR